MNEAAAPTQAVPVDAVRELAEPSPSAVPETLALPAPVLPAADSPFRTSPLLTKLALLERAHGAADNARFRRRFLMVVCLLGTLVLAAILGLLVGLGVFWSIYDDPYSHAVVVQGAYFIDGYQVNYAQYQIFVATYPSHHVPAAISAVASGVGVFLLLPLIVWFLFIRRLGRVDEHGFNLNEHIAGIVRIHPAEVDAWGGPGVLRNRDLVRELLDIAGAGRRRPAERPAR